MWTHVPPHHKSNIFVTDSQEVNMTITLPQSEHFTYHELADGVWAAIVISTGLAASNSGIVDLGDRTLIFDTTLSPASGAELRTVAESVTGRPVTYVLNSH